MQKFTHIVNNSFGLHVRPAGLIASKVAEFPDTTITITRGPETVVADSAIKLMSLGVKKGDTLTLTCDGEYEQNAIEAIGELILEIL